MSIRPLNLKLNNNRVSGENVKRAIKDIKSEKIRPKKIIFTYSVTNNGTDQILNIYKGKRSGTVPHIIIGRNGNIIQLLPLNRMSKSLNDIETRKQSIVVLLENPGWLLKEPMLTFTEESLKKIQEYKVDNTTLGTLIKLKDVGFPTTFWKNLTNKKILKKDRQSVLSSLVESDKSYFWTSYFNRVDEDNVLKKRHKNDRGKSYWYKYSEIQLKSAYELCNQLKAKFSIDTIIGYEDVYKTILAPGPAFPMESLRRNHE